MVSPVGVSVHHGLTKRDETKLLPGLFLPPSGQAEWDTVSSQFQTFLHPPSPALLRRNSAMSARTESVGY